ncbi:MAG: hypothetical protein RMY16_02815 [Nostoc sp. DedQUE12b]|nr:hypothetical protein [Nostoc sp. DedQUE12b]MDZ8084516.1 hypothetical protein [Nostoc sp. DedQUE12b]
MQLLVFHLWWLRNRLNSLFKRSIGKRIEDASPSFVDIAIADKLFGDR